MIRKALIQIGTPAPPAFMAWNAYLAVSHLKQMQNIAARTLDSSTIQAKISSVLKDLTDMETGQRGYRGGPIRTKPPLHTIDEMILSIDVLVEKLKGNPS